MATYKTNFSSWAGLEALLGAAQSYEGTAGYAAIRSSITSLTALLFSTCLLYTSPSPRD